MGTGGGGIVRVGSIGAVVTVEETGMVLVSRPLLPPMPNRAAVVAAPTAADAPATMARVNFDILPADMQEEGGDGGYMVAGASACLRRLVRCRCSRTIQIVSRAWRNARWNVGQSMRSECLKMTEQPERIECHLPTNDWTILDESKGQVA